MKVDGMLRIFNRSEKLHNLKYSNYIGDGDTKTFNALSENKPYGDDYLIQKIECVGDVQKRMGTRLRKLILVYSKKKLSDGKTIGGKGRLTDSLIDKLAHYYGNAIRCNSTSVKEMRKAIWAVFGVILAALMMNRCTGFVLQIQIHGCHTPGLALHTTVAGKCPSSPEDKQEKQGESRDSNDHRPDAAARKRLIVQEMTMANVVVLILLPPLASASSSERPMIYYCMLFARARPPLPRDVVPVTFALD
ncbi:uncharacterized protein TNCV_2071651 [Trichonephila clavipes]|uniref:Mutator-like transposase domain-containing protein n=1 Tax=Trichonephila clavipes TaxID=2585209 RepID=A0A8X6W3C8_TRICX|nr:uncharacterized protein TNCV_2071651 [Trichonephila clavipes]